MPRGGARPGAGRKRSEKPTTPVVDGAPSLNAASIENKAQTRRGFRPGVSGNPGGRPKAFAEVKAHAAQYTAEAIDSLVKIARHKATPSPVKVAAWREVMDRAIGKPPQAITGDGGGPIQIATIVDELHP